MTHPQPAPDRKPPTLRRRSLLGAAVAAGSALAVTRGPFAFGAPRTQDLPARVPKVLSAPGVPGTVQTPGFPVGHLGVSWVGPEVCGAVRLRYADGWSGWRSLRSLDSADERRRSLLWVGPATAYEFRPAPLAKGVRLHAINTVDGPPTAATLGRPTPLGRLTADAAATRSRFPYLNRAGWGAEESLRFGPDGTEIFPTRFFDVQTLTVHHTVSANSDPDPAATVRAIYFFHAVTEDWGDIGYHLLIDEAGTVYEGRYSGPDSLPVFGPRSVGPRPSMCNAAHVGGFNAGNVGVALLGDLTGTGPAPSALDSLTKVLAALATVTDLDPLGTTTYVNPISGATKTVSTIAGHRDWAPTECPGNTFYPTLPQLRRSVAALMS